MGTEDGNRSEHGDELVDDDKSEHGGGSGEDATPKKKEDNGSEGESDNQLKMPKDQTAVSNDSGLCTVPKYHAAVDYTPRLRAPWNLPRCTANSDTCKAVANHSLGLTTANSYLGMTST